VKKIEPPVKKPGQGKTEGVVVRYLRMFFGSEKTDPAAPLFRGRALFYQRYGIKGPGAEDSPAPHQAGGKAAVFYVLHLDGVDHNTGLSTQFAGSIILMTVYKREGSSTMPGNRIGGAVFAALIAALLIKVFLFDFMIAEGRSMDPVIKNGTVLVVNRAAYGLRNPWNGKYLFRWALPLPGDVVVFFTPQGDLAVKRCGAMIPGNRFFALGDNSLESYDSRSYGPVPVEHILGRVLGIK
jgi:signal peptidase I